MATDVKTISVPPNSETARLLRRAVDEPLLIENNGVRYRVVRVVDDPFANYDPEGAKIAADRAFGSLTGIDVEEFLAELREQRTQDSEGRPA